ncbi:SurA N-terminal domain-containing protein [Halobacillus amylolyticus]|uniref:SurA N-terminal domain-containing protein n=1 Tax=Halobacillus amylolyticus TaxID=2932259 RepID=A0ABY4HCB0_9BACI|nr:SurA N-terminal domain-containing protein [Halobacillus amylolyticus]UOR12536.1 SurA N-terminal domain-containing protein [Halobacillus amylolyticus]
MKKTWITAIMTILALFSLAACSGEDNSETSQSQPEEAESTENKTGPVATVNGKEIPRKEFTQQFEVTKQQYQQMGMDIKGKEEQLKQGVVNQLIGLELLTQKAAEEEITVTDEEVDKQYEQITAQFPSEDAKKQAFEKNGLTEGKLKKDLKEQLKVQKYVKENTEEATVSDEEVKKQYDTMMKGQKEAPSFEKSKEQIKQQLLTQKQNQKTTQLVEKLRKDAEVKVTL